MKALFVHSWLVGTLIGTCSLLPGCDQEQLGPLGIQRAAVWSPLPVIQDPLVRMPGTQQNQGTTLEGAKRCMNCHADYNSQVEPGFNWQGSMMAHASRDFIFWASFAVAGQDSIWALGRPNAMDLCERCHFPKGWLEERSDPPNASAMVGDDFDGVQCDFCHTMVDPFFEQTHQGLREGSDWLGYWDETNASATPSQQAAELTLQEDRAQAPSFSLFNGNPLYDSNNQPSQTTYTESGGGQYFISPTGNKRAAFADAGAKHKMRYSRFNKSRYFCSSCHDVSNPALANLSHGAATPGDGVTILPSEQNPANSYFHLERTFSEFRLSAYGQQGGSPGVGPFSPGQFNTSLPGDAIATCQDCHMRDVSGVGCNKTSGVDRPGQSTEHPKSGQPLHDLTGGNVFVSTVLASAVPGSPNYDATNAALLGQGASVLTLDLTLGLGINAPALLAGAERARQQLELAASITDLSYNAQSGVCIFRVQNNTGHKLISGYPEGRRMFLNVQVLVSGEVVHEVNPYDAAVGTLRGLPPSISASSPPLGPGEVALEELIYEVHPSSDLTGEQKTFHMVLSTGRHKDNRIPPKGFLVAQAAQRQVEPVWQGSPAPAYFTAQEYAGGFDEVHLALPVGADMVQVRLYYQVTSREFMEFLRDEINGTPSSGALPSTAYIIQSDPFFSALRAWGDVIWQLWEHNKAVPGAAPILMTQASISGNPAGCLAPIPTLLGVAPGDGELTASWTDLHGADPAVVGYTLSYDQAGKTQQVAQPGLTTSYQDTALSNGQQYCYKVSSRYAGCQSAYSNIICAAPLGGLGAGCGLANQCKSGFCVSGACCESTCPGGTCPGGSCQVLPDAGGTTDLGAPPDQGATPDAMVQPDQGAPDSASSPDAAGPDGPHTDTAPTDLAEIHQDQPQGRDQSLDLARDQSQTPDMGQSWDAQVEGGVADAGSLDRQQQQLDRSSTVNRDQQQTEPDPKRESDGCACSLDGGHGRAAGLPGMMVLVLLGSLLRRRRRR